MSALRDCREPIRAGVRSPGESVARDEGRRSLEQVRQGLPGLRKVGFSISLRDNEPPLQAEEVTRFARLLNAYCSRGFGATKGANQAGNPFAELHVNQP